MRDRSADRAARSVGWRDVLIVAAVAVGVVLGAAILTSALPTDLQRVIFHTPLLIVVLITGTAIVLWRIAARRPPDGADPSADYAAASRAVKPTGTTPGQPAGRSPEP